MDADTLTRHCRLRDELDDLARGGCAFGVTGGGPLGPDRVEVLQGHYPQLPDWEPRTPRPAPAPRPKPNPTRIPREVRQARREAQVAEQVQIITARQEQRAQVRAERERRAELKRQKWADEQQAWAAQREAKRQEEGARRAERAARQDARRREEVARVARLVARREARWQGRTARRTVREEAPTAPAPARVPGRPPECTSVPALATSYYPAVAAQAEARLKAGWRQGRCTTCLLWRWADEPCAAAAFKRVPVQGRAYVID
ncbi:hypothetical protein GCM10017784_35100 [Deinococcus indicus]|uniref:hypothetical protein n=1 Tax=Deinococcus indicus TaxID=223556 RepID=UPI001748F181|nr:hypothetical protein [Deinococcus indicus]GHG37649.1 hypothetical protein GCM10017784_35100 [Deinococcus indicus]